MTPAPGLLDCLASVDLDWETLRREARAVVLFGSRASGHDRVDSDWDLLCIGPGLQRLTRTLDILWVPVDRAMAADSGWVGSELANHIARFGHVIVGELPWTENYDRQELALARKRRQLDGHVRGLARVWPKLNAVYRRRQLTELRRDLQRYALLGACEPVPPTAVLDQMWVSEAAPELRVLELLDRAGVGSAALQRMLVAARTVIASP